MMFILHWTAFLFGLTVLFLFGFCLGGLTVFAMKTEPTPGLFTDDVPTLQ